MLVKDGTKVNGVYFFDEDSQVVSNPRSLESYIHSQMNAEGAEEKRILDRWESRVRCDDVIDGSIIGLQEVPGLRGRMFAFYYNVVETSGREEELTIQASEVLLFGKRVARTPGGKFDVQLCPMVYDLDAGLTPADDVFNFIGYGDAEDPTPEILTQAFDLATARGETAGWDTERRRANSC